MASAYAVLNGSTSSYANAASTNQSPQQQQEPAPFTRTSLSRWSVLPPSQTLPPVSRIKSLHVYDFDNTLFKTPLPNPSLWQGPTIGILTSQDTLANGGWWHDARILTATGEGIDKEEPRAWEGWWNDKIVDLVRLSMKQPDAFTVLLTGRAESGFAELVKRIVKAKGLEFDMIGLKPVVSPDNLRFVSTMHFKQLFLNALMETYSQALDIRIYEDRPKHTKGFRDFLAEYNRRQTETPTRGPIAAEVIQVADTNRSLDPVVEIAEVQHMINAHNAVAQRDPGRKRYVIKKTVFFTSYIIAQEDSDRLLRLANIPASRGDGNMLFHGNNILICPRPNTPAHLVQKAGGMGAKMKWQLTGFGTHHDRIWAASLQPVPHDASYHTDHHVPMVVLALKKGAKPAEASKIDRWTPVSAEDAIVFETTVGEKVSLRIEAEGGADHGHRGSKRKQREEESSGGEWSRQGPGRGAGHNTRGHHTSGRGSGKAGGRGHQNRGGGANKGGNQRGGRGRGRGAGGGFNYRSLDDVGRHGNDGYTQRRGGGGNGSGRGRGHGHGRGGGGGQAGGQDVGSYY
ncbi:uncharacterized protein J7T54_000245 [Emericellopsis cladophorae]|uniref:Swiss Army Knife RNA repair protein HAD domain-containing protein n=1 Tax=Emericellopsis cladophorae TaxID=2686198 RepID=A0A9Q0BCV6_9HYPO|nr:uncharacterized protein J7T54_000245 [Emericellopsis cladophorae]KAI6779945.1 hypothetical protein J7T54_000245 [Emericellopsis cladophorae]